MNPSSFFISGRYLFGFVLPGSVLIFSLLILTTSSPPSEILAKLVGGNLILMLAGGLIVGHSVNHWCFQFAMKMSEWLHHWSWLSASWEKSRFTVDKILIDRVRDALLHYSGDKDFLDSQTEDDLFGIAKRFVLEKSKPLSDKVNEFENEINLRAGNVLPLILFSLCWAVNLVVFRRCNWNPEDLAPLFTLAASIMMLRNVYPSWKDERKSIFEMFLIIYWIEFTSKDPRTRPSKVEIFLPRP